MTISDKIQIITSIISSIATFISIVIAVQSLKKSQKAIKLTEISIEEANRPYIVAYTDLVQVSSTIHEYLIIKNFGKTGATITSFQINPPYEKDYKQGQSGGFNDLKNTFLAPNQSLTTILYANFYNKDRKGITNISITYKTNQKEYKDNFIINEDINYTFSKVDPPKTKPLNQIITRAAEELIRKNL